MATLAPEAPPSVAAGPANAAATSNHERPTGPDRDDAHKEPESEPSAGTVATALVGSAQQQQAGGDDTAERPRARSTAKNPRSDPSAPSADAFFGRREPLSVRAVADHLSRTSPSSPQPDEADSQGTVMDEITALYDLSRRLPLTWDLVAWDQYDRLRLWYHDRTPRKGVDPFHHGGTDVAARSAFGLRPHNWHAMHAHEYYPWLKYVTLDHLREAEAHETDGALRVYDSTGLACSVEFWSGVDEGDHLMKVRGSRDHSLGHAFFISLFWKYRMASHKAGALDGKRLAHSWAAFHAIMKTKPHVVYDKLEDFYNKTLDGTLVRIHEVSRHHGLGCAVPIRDCPMCTDRTPKLPALCRRTLSHLLPVELRFYLAELDELLELQDAAAKKPRMEE